MCTVTVPKARCTSPFVSLQHNVGVQNNNGFKSKMFVVLLPNQNLNSKFHLKRNVTLSLNLDDMTTVSTQLQLSYLVGMSEADSVSRVQNG